MAKMSFGPRFARESVPVAPPTPKLREASKLFQPFRMVAWDRQPTCALRWTAARRVRCRSRYRGVALCVLHSVRPSQFFTANRWSLTAIGMLWPHASFGPYKFSPQARHPLAQPAH